MSLPQAAHYSTSYHMKHNRPLILTAIILASCAFTFGFDASVVGGVFSMPLFIKQFGSKTAKGYVLTARDISIMSATPTTGSLMGMVVVGMCADRFGRKNTIFLGCVFGVIAAVLQTAAYNIAMFTVGRIVAGVSAFVLVSMGITMQNEISPAHVRSAISALTVVLIAIATVITSGINWGTYKLPNEASYKIPIGLQILWPFLIALGMTYVMDSPTAYLIKGDDDKAMISLRRVRQSYSEIEVQTELQNLKHQKALRQSEVEMPWSAMFKGVNLRRTLLAVYVGVFQIFSGVLYASVYATVFLSEIGSTDPFLLVFASAILGLVGAVIGLLLVEKTGRRTLTLGTFTAIFIIDLCIGALGFADSTDPRVPKAIAAFCLMYSFFYNAGPGQFSYSNAAEMPTARLKNKTSAFTLFCNSMSSLFVAYVFPFISQPDAANLGAKTYLIFAGFSLICVILTFFYLPETRGRTPAELDEMFAARLPARKFKGYVCAVAPEKVEPEIIDKEYVHEVKEV